MDVGKEVILKIIDLYSGKADLDMIKKEFEVRQPQQSVYLWAHLRDLCKFGDISEEAPKVYSLTEKGKERILKKSYSWEGFYNEKTKKKTEEAEWI